MGVVPVSRKSFSVLSLFDGNADYPYVSPRRFSKAVDFVRVEHRATMHEDFLWVRPRALSIARQDATHQILCRVVAQMELFCVR